MLRCLLLALVCTASALHSPSVEELQPSDEVVQEDVVISKGTEEQSLVEQTAKSDEEEPAKDGSAEGSMEEGEAAEDDADLLDEDDELDGEDLDDEDLDDDEDDEDDEDDDDDDEDDLDDDDEDEDDLDDDEDASLLEAAVDGDDEDENDDADDEDEEDEDGEDEDGEDEDGDDDDENDLDADGDAKVEEADVKSPTMLDEAAKEKSDSEGIVFTADMPVEKGPTDQASVFAKAKAEGKPAMVLVTKGWCPHCKDLGESMNADPSMKTLMAKFVAFHAPDDQGEAWHGEIGYVPRAFFYNKDGQQIDVHSPYAQYPYFFDNSQVLQAGMQKALSQA